MQEAEADGVGVQGQRQAGRAEAVALERAACQGGALKQQRGHPEQQRQAHEAAQEQREGQHAQGAYSYLGAWTRP